MEICNAERDRLAANSDDQETQAMCYQTINQLQADLRESKMDFQNLERACQGFDNDILEKNKTIADMEKDIIAARAESHRMREQVTRLVTAITQLKNSNIALQAQIDSKMADEASQIGASQYATELHERCMQYEKALQEAAYC